MIKFIFNYFQQRSLINHKKNLCLTLIVTVLILLLFACGIMHQKHGKLLEFYCVEIGNFPTYKNALNLSNEIKLIGGAGYIFFDSYYHVLISCYSNYNDAKTTLEKVKKIYHFADILTISSSSFFPQKNLSSRQNSTIENLLKQSENVFYNFEKLIADFEKDCKSSQNVNLQLSNLYNQFYPYCDAFLNQFKNSSKYNNAKGHLNKMLTALKSFQTENNNILFSTLNYSLIDFAINRTQFLSCF